MKRKILFRGKRIDNSQWIEGGFFKHLNRTLCAMGDCEKPEDIDYLILKSGFSDWNMPKPLEAHPVIPSTVGQFTGLTDKNGVKIFEGDIVTAFRGNKFEVVFYDKNLSFELSQMQTGVIVPFTTWDYNVEVIGNIHDNPEIK